jgi:hypothetical protein
MSNQVIIMFIGHVTLVQAAQHPGAYTVGKSSGRQFGGSFKVQALSVD